MMEEITVKIKNTNIKTIFETMEYGTSSVNVDLAKAWLEKQGKQFYPFIGQNEFKKGTWESIKNAENNVFADVLQPDGEEVDGIMKQLTSQENSWGSLPHIDKANLLNRYANEISKNSSLICQLEVLIRGILLKDTKNKALPMITEYLQYFISCIQQTNRENAQVKHFTVIILPKDSFLGCLGWSMAPALAAGNAVIIQSEPEITPVLMLLVKLAIDIGIPPGTISVIPGHENLERILLNEHVTTVACFDNFSKKKYSPIVHSFSKQLVLLSPEKIPMIVFENADLDSACDSVIDAAWGYQGLLPWCINTIIVQENVMKTFISKLKFRLSKVNTAHANDQMADVATLQNENAVSAFRKMVQDAKLQGVEVYQNVDTDCFQPTLFIGGLVYGNNVILPDNNLPVVTILGFRTAAEAVALANNRRQGLAATVWTENLGLAHEVAQNLQAANVWVNNHGNFTPNVPFTPQKQSGCGHFGGKEAFNQFFKKERVVNNFFNVAIGKDLLSVINSSRKAQIVWAKMTSLQRFQLFLKLADQVKSSSANLISCSKITESFLTKFVHILYQSGSSINNEGKTNTKGSYLVSTLSEPSKVVIFKMEDNFDLHPLKTIIGTILQGSAVVLRVITEDQFYKKISELMSQCGIPPGILNVFVQKGATIGDFSSDFPKITDVKFVVAEEDCWENCVSTLEFKSVWCNVGESFL